MHKITVHFVSDVKGVYTKEIETATSEADLYFKKKRMIYRWLNILVPYIKIDNIDLFSWEEKLELIQFEIKRLNIFRKGEQDRIFDLTVEEYDN
jgi:uncharacterized membrane protein YobD (UPF0266 family)